MNFPDADNRFWLDLVQWLVTLALAVSVWLRKPGEDAGRAVAELRDDIDRRLQSHTARLTEIEAHMEHMPTDEELAKLEGAIQTLDERTRGMAERMGVMAASLQRIETYLLSNRT